MGACKEKQNLRYKKVCITQNKKVRYDGLNKDEVSYIKTKKQYDQVSKELNNFWSTAPRDTNNMVLWDDMDEQTLDYFEYINRLSEKLLKKISKLEDNGVECDKVLNIFLMLNCKSVSF